MGKITKIPASISRYTSAPIDAVVKRKVAAYARVSTDSEEQLTSYAAQVSYYEEYIKGHKDWEFINVYTDEGISGTSMRGREGFQRMISDALAGKIQLIITKSVSRFARNTVDSLTTIRKLKDHNVECYFEKEGLWTFDSKSETILAIMSSLAQEESRSISENVTWGHRKRMADGKFSIAYSTFLGYDKGEDGKLVVNPEQAKIVKLIYRLFLDGMTPYSIAKELTNRQIKTPTGKDKWNQTTVIRILTNEKYKGDALLQKYYTVDFLSKKTKRNNGEIPQYYITDDHEAIIEPAVFDLVQKEIATRPRGNSRYSGISIFSSKIKCGCCGGWFGSKVWHSNDKYRKVIYQCNQKFKQKCSVSHISEKEIKSVFVSAVNQLIKNKKELIANIEMIYRVICDVTTLEFEQERLGNEMTQLAEQVETAMYENSRVALNQDEYRTKNNKLIEQFETTKAKYNEISEQIADKQNRSQQLRQFCDALQKTNEPITEFDEGLWGALVDCITVNPDGTKVVTFNDGSIV